MQVSVLDVAVSGVVDAQVPKDALYSGFWCNGRRVGVRLGLIFGRENVGLNHRWHVLNDVAFAFEFVRQALADVGAERLSSAVSEITRSWHVLSHRTDENHR